MESTTLAKFESELSSISWHELEHAYGPADGTPDWIRALRSEDKKLRQKAIEQLYISIFHQGSVYSASLTAVPFLQVLVEDPSTQDRDEIILLLLGLAVGFPAEWLPAGFDINKWSQLALEIYHSQDYVDLMVNIYHEVRKGINGWLRLLINDDLSLRIATEYALAWFREDANIVAPQIRQILNRTKDEAETANQIISLGLIDGYLRSSQDSELFTAYLGSGNSKLIRTCAAIALVNTSPQTLDNRVVSILFEALENGDALPLFHWNNGYISGYAALTLGELSKYLPEQIIPGLSDAIGYMNIGGVVAITRSLGNVLFPKRLAVNDGFLSLNHDQQMFLSALADNWIDLFGETYVDLNFIGVLRNLGLPDSREDFLKFVKPTNL